MKQPLLVINNFYKIAFERNKLNEKEQEKQKHSDSNSKSDGSNTANISHALNELSNAIEEGVL